MKMSPMLRVLFGSLLAAACGEEEASGPPKPAGPTKGELGKLSFRFDDWGIVDLSASIQHQTTAPIIFNPLGDTVLPADSAMYVLPEDPAIVTCQQSSFEREGHVLPCYAHGIGETVIAVHTEAGVIDRVKVRTAVATAISVNVDRGEGYVLVDPFEPINAGEEINIGFGMHDEDSNRVVTECAFDITTDQDRYTGLIDCSNAGFVLNAIDAMSLTATQRFAGLGREPLAITVQSVRGD